MFLFHIIIPEITSIVAEMNGHVKEGNQLIDFLSFGSSDRSGAQLLGAEDQIVDGKLINLTSASF